MQRISVIAMADVTCTFRYAHEIRRTDTERTINVT